MRRSIAAGLGALAVLALAGCSNGDGWFGSGSASRGGTVTEPRPAAGTMGSTTAGTVAGPMGSAQARDPGSGMSGDHPDTLSGMGPESGASDAPGGN